MILLGFGVIANEARRVGRGLVDHATGMVGMVAILGLATALAIPRRH